MRLILISAFIALFSGHAHSQCSGSGVSSLIPNPSFENYSCCPSAHSQMTCANSWIQASAGTTDYLNTCGYDHPPSTQNPPLPLPDGNGYVGMYDGTNSTGIWKEYLGVCLASPLVAGTQYTLEISMAAAIGAGSYTGSALTTREFVIYGATNCSNLPFTGSQCPTTTAGWNVVHSQTVNLSTTSWTTVTFTFTPTFNITGFIFGGNCGSTNGGMTHTTFGSQTNYYFIDNMILNETTFFTPPVAEAGTGATVNCATPGVTLNGSATGGTPGYTYSWSPTTGLSNPNIANPTATPGTNTTYTLTVTDLNTCTSTDNVTVTVDNTPPTANAGTNVVLDCNNQTANLSGSGGGSYSWAASGGGNIVSGGSSATPTVDAAGTYTVTVTGSNGCTDTDAATVTTNFVPPNPGWSTPGTICEASGNVNLNSLISGTTGGSWTGPGVSGNTFNPSGLSGNQSITYSVGTGVCLQTSAQNINVIPDVDPSWTNPATACDGASSINLNSLITGTSGGTWSGSGVSGSTFDPTGLTGTTAAITYTVGTSPCQETSTQSIVVETQVSPNWNLPSSICGNSGTMDLSTLITGTTGGTFSGAGVTGNNFDPSAQSGSVNITYDVGVGACAQSQAHSINVTPDVDSSWTNPSPVCLTGGNIDLSTLITGTTGGTFSGTNVTGTMFDPSGLAGQTVNITYTVGTAPCEEQLTLPVTVTNVVTATWTLPGTICETGNILDLNTLVSGTPGGTFTGTGVSANNFDPSGQSGIINITYTVGNGSCTQTENHNIDVLAAPTIPAVTSISDSICVGDTTSLIASGSGAGVVYNVYDAATGGNLVGQTPLVVNPTATTTYYIEAVNANNCSHAGALIPVTVVVEVIPVADAGADQTICLGDPVTLTATGGGTYAWSPGGQTSASITVNPTDTTYYYVTVTNTICSATDSALVTVLSGAHLNAQNDYLTVPFETSGSIDIVLNDTDADPNTVNIFLDVINGTSMESSGIIDYMPNMAFEGSDSLIYIICDNACPTFCDTAVLYITVEDMPGVVIPGGVSVNGDGINDAFVITGLQNYPENTIQIFNRWGSVVYTAEPYNNDWAGESVTSGSLGGNRVTAGTYYYILDLGDGSDPIQGFFVLKY